MISKLRENHNTMLIFVRRRLQHPIYVKIGVRVPYEEFMRKKMNFVVAIKKTTKFPQKFQQKSQFKLPKYETYLISKNEIKRTTITLYHQLRAI